MTITRVTTLLASLVLATACTTGGDDGSDPTPEADLSTVREVAWTVTAEQISGAKGARMGSIGGFMSVDSVAAGNLVISAASSRDALTLAGIDARTGEVAWRRALPMTDDGSWSCVDDEGGSNVACSVSELEAKTAEVTIIDLRSGTVRKQLRIDADQSFAIDGDDLYLTTFTPADKDRRLDVTAERRSWSTGEVAWNTDTSFAIDGWGHDGGQGFTIGAKRVIAYSASWEVVLDKSTGRLLARSESGRYEEPLTGGGWLVTDSGDGVSDGVTVTLFSPAGDPIAEERLSGFYFGVQGIDDRLVTTGRHLREQATGRSLFEAPERQQIFEVADAGRVALTEPAGSEHGEDEKLSYQVWDVESDKLRGTVDIRADWSSDSLGGGPGVLLISERYDDKAERTVPSTLHVIDTRKAAEVATVELEWTTEDFDSPTVTRTRAGVAVTGGTGVKGLVVGP